MQRFKKHKPITSTPPRTAFVLLVMIPLLSKAQFYYPLNIGPKIGLTYTRLSNVYPTLYRDGYQNYTWKEEPGFGALAGVFLSFKPNEGKFAIQPEIYYSMDQTQYQYSDINALEYTLKIQYNSIQLNTLVKYYPIGGLNIGVGPQMGLALSGDQLYYKSNGAAEAQSGPDSFVESVLRKGLYTKNNFQAIFSLGYEMEWGICFDLRYQLGLTDVIEVQNNSHGWTEHHNQLNNFQFSVSYGFGIDN